MRMKWRFTLTWSAVMAALMSCNNESGSLGLGNSVFDNNYSVVVVDTITVVASTVLLDSIPTSGTGSILIGGYSDPALGVLNAEGNIQFDKGETWEPPDNAIFDSLVLVLRYNGYHYGDTSIALTFDARRITQAFKTYDLPQFWVDERQYSALYKASSFYNSSAIRYDISLLGTKTVRPRPNSSDSLSIRLDDNLGKEWINLAKEQSVFITEADKFTEYFKGIAISTISPSEAVVGFTPVDTKIRLYYREYSDEKLVQKFHEFPVGTSQPYFTRISANRYGTILASLTSENEELSSSKTGENVFIQAGTGVVAKVTFPHIRKMLDLEDLLLVNSAKLILVPVDDSYDGEFPLPQDLTLFETNKTNLPLKQLYADYNVTEEQRGMITIDPEFDETSGYVFTITEYMQDLLSTEGNQEKGLLIMPPADEIGKGVERTYLNARESPAYRVRLKIWYTRKQ
jgi:hypothetical protein